MLELGIKLQPRGIDACLCETHKRCSKHASNMWYVNVYKWDACLCETHKHCSKHASNMLIFMNEMFINKVPYIIITQRR